ncbi:MAG: DUF5615 family PIN-like protein [Thermoproteota archaeon]
MRTQAFFRRALIRFLKSRGFDVKHAFEGLKNSELLSLAEREERVLPTHDHDFLGIEFYKPVCSILVLLAYSIVEMEQVLLKFLENLRLTKLKVKLFYNKRRLLYSWRGGRKVSI